MKAASRPYFAVQPYGVGTASVECLSSLLHRLALAHGVTRHQFITHLRLWWAKRQGRRLPRCEELRWDGYSPNVALGLAALKDATGLDLSPCSLIALQSTCAGNCVGATKHIRWWCPACFRDDLGDAREPYDRLVWRIQGIDRCSVHRHKLISSCPVCGAIQSNDTSAADLRHCSCCGGDLVQPYGPSAYLPQPTFGEAQVERLIANLGTISKLEPFPLRRFFASLGVERAQIEEELGDLIHTRCIMSRPALTSVISTSACFDVDVLQLLMAPKDAARQATFDFKRALPERRSRPFPRIGHARSAWFEKQLIAAIQAGPPFPSVPAFCRSKDFSCQAARHRFSALIRQLSRKHFEWKRRCARKLRSKARRVLRGLGCKRDLLTQREIILLVAQRSGAPLHAVRALVRSDAPQVKRRVTRGLVH